MWQALVKLLCMAGASRTESRRGRHAQLRGDSQALEDIFRLVPSMDNCAMEKFAHLAHQK